MGLGEKEKKKERGERVSQREGKPKTEEKNHNHFLCIFFSLFPGNKLSMINRPKKTVENQKKRLIIPKRIIIESTNQRKKYDFLKI